jgi:hypothetical protein
MGLSVDPKVLDKYVALKMDTVCLSEALGSTRTYEATLLTARNDIVIMKIKCIALFTATQAIFSQM